MMGNVLSRGNVFKKINLCNHPTIARPVMITLPNTPTITQKRSAAR
jgi:hypothetical protein